MELQVRTIDQGWRVKVVRTTMKFALMTFVSLCRLLFKRLLSDAFLIFIMLDVRQCKA